MWTEARIEELKNMWLAGKTASECAAALDITRNAAIGKVHRLRLPSDNHTSKGGQRRFDYEAILNAWASGENRAAIAAEFGCCSATVTNICAQGRTQGDARAIKRQGGRKRIADDVRAAIVAAYPPRPTLDEIAERFSVSKASVMNILAESRKAA